MLLKKSNCFWMAVLSNESLGIWNCDWCFLSKSEGSRFTIIFCKAVLVLFHIKITYWHFLHLLSPKTLFLISHLLLWQANITSDWIMMKHDNMSIKWARNSTISTILRYYFLLILFSSSLRKAVHHDGSQKEGFPFAFHHTSTLQP